jgi:trimethylamine:corrinoid methyltransferase-like protein
MQIRGKINRGDFIAKEAVSAVIDAAFDLLSKTGIKVSSGAIAAALGAMGYAEKNGRILIPEQRARAFLEKLRGDDAARREIEKKRERKKFTAVQGSYAAFFDNPASGKTEPLNTELAVRAAQFAALAAERYGGFESCAAGTPQDAPAALGSLLKYKISAEYCSGPAPVEPTSLLAADFMFPMAEVIGQPISRLPVYPVSPLCLGGESAEIVYRFKDRLESFYVFSMPMLGISAPLSVKGGLALSLAETLGAGLLMGEITGLRCLLRPNIFPGDLQVMNYAFGSPRKFLYECIAEDFTAQVLNMPLNYHSVNMHTNCAVSGAQSALEKISLMSAGAMLGATKFYCAGSLSLDEIFSPRELMLDTIRLKHIEEIAGGFELEAPDDLVSMRDEIQDGLNGGFVMSDRTLERHGDYVNYSPFVNRKQYQAFMNGGGQEMAALAEDEAKKMFIEGHPAVLAADAVQALNALYAAAEKQLMRAGENH